MATNSNLHMSRAGKTDEFYTQLSTIENELKHYKQYFEGKTVFCNCDDPYESNFFKFFAIHFNEWHLKKLIVTCYKGSPIMGDCKPIFDAPESYKLEITKIEDENGDGNTDLLDVDIMLKSGKLKPVYLEGDGDFRSEECLKLLQECDVVVTNPPFSLMKEYLPLIVNSGKQFLVLGNINHATFNETFTYFKNNKVWLGYNSGHFWFRVPDYYEEKKTDFKIDENGVKWRRMGNICWFTNIDIAKRHQYLDLYKTYTPEEFPDYDTYDAIECGKYGDIPMDTDRVIGVPISYLAYHCPDQFEIVGEFRHGCDNEYDLAVPIVKGKAKYTRIAIRKIGD